MTRSRSLIDEAHSLVDDARQTDAHVTRLACWLARAELEEHIHHLLDDRGYLPGDGSMRSLLSCLAVAYRNDSPSVATAAIHAWATLSEASHHHAYELSPTVAEARHLVELVRDLGDVPPGPS